jgi:methionyl-tRNA formyltransferase
VEYVYDGLMQLGAEIATETIDLVLEGDGGGGIDPTARLGELYGRRLATCTQNIQGNL